MRVDEGARRLATIDVGTNTILLLVAEVNGKGGLRLLEDLAEITRLGEGVDRSGFLGEGGQERSLDVLRRYCARCRSLNVEEISVAGTSALRDAINAGDFKARLKRELGWDLRVLSPEEESWYSYLAVQRGLALRSKELLVVDVGGGSTQLIWGKDGGWYRWASLQMGTVRLTERFLFSDPVGEEECDRLSRAVDDELGGLLVDWKKEAPFDTMIGIAGTFTTLVAVEKGLVRYALAEVHGSHLKREEVRRQIQVFQGKTIAERRQIPGLEPKRADVILAGALLIDRIMALFRMDRVVVSDQGIRYGLLYERLEGSHG
ncbi:MAG: Ppx/GppA family phosphatase [Candidatus Binatia bacterium]